VPSHARRTKYFDIPVIFLSAYNDTETVHRVFTAGADDYVFKPIIGPELITRTRNRLRRARLAPVAAVEAASSHDSRPDVSMLISNEEVSRDLFTQLTRQGLVVEKLSKSGNPLIERLTCPVEQRPGWCCWTCWPPTTCCRPSRDWRQQLLPGVGARRPHRRGNSLRV